MRYLIITHDDGDIVDAYIDDVRNAETYLDDGYLTGSDGRNRPLQHTTLIFDATNTLTNDVISWRHDGRFWIDTATGDLYEDNAWTPPDTSPPPDMEQPL